MTETAILSPEDEKILPSSSTTIETTTVISETLNYNIPDFKLQKILNNNVNRKTIALLGNFPELSEADQALVIFEKRAFSEGEVQTDKIISPVDEENDLLKAEKSLTYFSEDLKIETEFINDIYGSFQVTPHQNLNGVKTTVIYPATDKHIAKYSISQKFLITETPDMYQSITLPYLKSSQFSLEWVYNILEHKQESERIIYEDSDPHTGFILLPDLKWDGKNVENLYLLAIIHKHDIMSLRDLTSEHLPLLRNLKNKSAEAIMQKYGLKSSELRMYFHYQPSFYHLHIHINPIRNEAPGIWCEKSHMLDTVINNLELMFDYYCKATIPFVLFESNALLDKYDEKFNVRKRMKIDNIDIESSDE